MHVLDLLTHQHREVDLLLGRLRTSAAGTGEEVTELVDQLLVHLTAHAYVEERVFYPTVQQALPHLDEEIRRDLEEHRGAEQRLVRVDDLPQDDPGFVEAVEALATSVREHVEDEEQDLFPRLREELDPGILEDLGTVVEALLELAPTHPQEKGSTVEAPVEEAVEGEAADAWDRIRRRLSG